MVQKRVMYAEVVTFECREVIGLPAIQEQVYQPRNKTLKMFWYVFVHFICKPMFGNNITKSQIKRIVQYMFLLQGVAGNSRLKSGFALWALTSCYKY